MIKNLYENNVFNEPSSLDKNNSIEDNALKVMDMRYFIDLPNGQKETNYSQLCRRVARIIASGEYKQTTSDEELSYIMNIENSIYNDMMSHRFLFNSPALFSAGVGISSNKNLSDYLYKSVFNENTEELRELYKKISTNINKNQMLFACFTIEVADSVEDIFDSVKHAAIISKYGGGVGANFGNLREKGGLIDGGCGGEASGPVSFMQNWNTMGSTVVQGGKRRAALMGMLNSHHPDIEEFITCKQEDGNLSYFNISIAIDNKFMEAVKHDKVYDLYSPSSNQVVKSIRARELWDKVCVSAHKNGDPGIFFSDLANEDSLLKSDSKYFIESTNPCGEQPLPNFTSCNLGSINLNEFVDENNKFDLNKFRGQVLRSVYYLDLVIDVSNYPLKKIEKNTKDIRPIGLGVMGLADMCIKMGIKYGSVEFENISSLIAKNLAKYSLIGSAALAIKKGAYPHFNHEDGARQYLLSKLSIYEGNNIIDLVKQMISDKNTNEVPISFINTLEECSKTDDYILKDDKAIEELYNYIFDSNIMIGGLRNSRRLTIAPTGTISLLLNTSSSIEPNFAYEWNRMITVGVSEKQELTYYHKYYNDYNKNKGLLISAHNVTPEQHVKVVGLFAPYIDASISKTINMPHESTVEDVKWVYEYCYSNNIKGITIYRDGSRNNQPLVKKDKDNEKVVKKELPEIELTTDIISRPKFMHGITTKSDSPFGSIYVTANFDKNGRMFETFISAGKSGSVSKSITEALSRVISLALRSGVDITELINTISNISGSEVWVYDTYNGKEIVVKSIPDATGKMLEDLNNYYNQFEIKKDPKLQKLESNKDEKFGHYRTVCPECSTKMMQTSGCSVCPSCGYSDCS